MIRQIDDKIEIKIKQAPISKIAIYRDRIEIVKGRTKEEIIRQFKITDENFKNRFVSFPMFLNNVISSSEDKALYYLDGVSLDTRRLPVPQDSQYDDSDIESYFKNYGGEYEGSIICLLQQLINPSMLLELYQKQFNYHFTYQIKITSMICTNLIVNFSKEDVVYIDYNGNIIDYGKPSNTAIRNNLLKYIENNKLVATQKDSNVIVTKSIDK